MQKTQTSASLQLAVHDVHRLGSVCVGLKMPPVYQGLQMRLLAGLTPLLELAGWSGEPGGERVQGLWLVLLDACRLWKWLSSRP